MNCFRAYLATLIVAIGIGNTPSLAKGKFVQPIGNAVTDVATEIVKNAIESKLAKIPQVGTIEIAFAPYPQRSAERLVVKVIESATESLMMAAYQFTSKPIADALCRAAATGVAVSVVVDAKSNQTNDAKSKKPYLESCGVAVVSNGQYPIMHDKFIIADGQNVETGSFNYSFAAAERNAENVIVIWGNAALAARYQAEFNRLFREGQNQQAP